MVKNWRKLFFSERWLFLFFASKKDEIFNFGLIDCIDSDLNGLTFANKCVNADNSDRIKESYLVSFTVSDEPNKDNF